MVLKLEKTKKSMNPRELVETALRVLVAWTDGGKPASPDLDILKAVFPSFAHLPDDELACQVIHNLNGRSFREPSRNDDRIRRVMDEVA
jgi:hypothetical protein